MDKTAFEIFQRSNASLYGRGVFTTAAVFRGEIFLWEKHWRRLAANAKALSISTETLDEATILEMLHERLDLDGISDGRVRLTLFDETPSPIWSSGEPQKTGIAILSGGRRSIPSDFKLTVSPFRVNSASPLAGVKSCNYLDNILAIDDARSRGFDEAIRLNELGKVTGGCMSNIFWSKSESLFTPSLATGCLPGTTRELVLEHLECLEVEVGIDELSGADAIYLTSAGIGVLQATELDGKTLSEDSHKIQDLFPQP